MNENIDLTKILKDCPKGTELWSDNYGKVRFKCINKSYDHPIFAERIDEYLVSYTKEGWFSIGFPASCLLWPSKDCRDWSKFSAPWYKKEKFDQKKLQPFDKVLVRNYESCKWKVDFYSFKYEECELPYACIGGLFKYCIPYNDDTKHLVGTKEETPEYYKYWED